MDGGIGIGGCWGQDQYMQNYSFPYSLAIGEVWGISMVDPLLMEVTADACWDMVENIRPG